MQKKPWIVNEVNSASADILLYGYIYESCASDFVKELNALEKTYSVINVRMNSGGGDVFDGFTIYNAIKRCSAEVNTFVDGIAGSMASIVALAGKKCSISKVGRIMTHKPSAWGGGTSEDLRQNADLLDGVQNMMCAIYVAKTGKTEEQCNSIFLNGKDNWFDAQQSIDCGLMDEIYDADPISLPTSTAMSQEAQWKGYHDIRFAAIFTQQNQNMKFQLSAANKLALGLNDTSDDAAIDAAITAVVSKANKVDQLTQERDAAVTKLNDRVKAESKAKVKAMITAASNDKKINAATAAQLETDYQDRPDDLQRILDGMAKPTSIVDQLKPGEADEDDSKLREEYEKLDKTPGGIASLMAKNMDRYKKLHKAKYGVDYQG